MNSFSRHATQKYFCGGRKIQERKMNLFFWKLTFSFVEWILIKYIRLKFLKFILKLKRKISTRNKEIVTKTKEKSYLHVWR